ncbi:uncharacterized protein [Miscanthus floridulus]|uniref:uncharacterized protein n=1 Tax=Miscanthus floridulus TaxID=154761 RepID=UPI0034586B95
MYTGQFIYYHRRATLSIGDILPLRGILKGAVICNVEHHAGDCGAPPSGCPRTTPSSSAATLITAPLLGHLGIVISRNPDNSVWVGGASRQRKAATHNGKADDVRHPPVPLLLRQQWPLLSTGGPHHVIYVG